MAGRGSFIPVPRDVSDTDTLYRFLSKLVEQLDVAFGNRGNAAFLPQSEYDDAQTAAAKAAVQSGSSTVLNPSDYTDGTITGLLSKVDAALLYARADGAKELTGVQSYSDDVTLDENYHITHKQYVDDADDSKLSLDGSNQATGTLSYAYTVIFSTDLDIINKGYVDNAFVKLDGSNNPTAVISYSTALSFTGGNDLVSKTYVDNAISTAVANHAALTTGVHGL